MSNSIQFRGIEFLIGRSGVTFVVLLVICLIPITMFAQQSSGTSVTNTEQQNVINTEVRETIFDRGVYFGGTMGNTNLSDNRSSWLVRPFLRHGLNDWLEGEFSIGIGMLNSTDYRTRILPVDYSVHAYPLRLTGLTSGSGVIRGHDVFAYAGLGVMNYHHSRILRPDDPFTVDAGRTISNTAHWSFDKNWVAQAPVGLGTRIWLDGFSSLMFKVGYTFSNTRFLAAASSGSKEGFWSASVGLSLRSFRSVQRPVPMMQIVESTQIVEEVQREDTVVSTDVTPQVTEESTIVAPVVEEVVEEIIEEPEQIIEAPTEPESPQEDESVEQEPESVQEVTDSDIIEMIEEVVPVNVPNMVNFDVLAWDFDEQSQLLLNDLLSYLNHNEDRALIISGMTDNTGLATINDILGYQRAWNVKEWLLNRGVAEDRVYIVRRNYIFPPGDNNTEDGRRLNRRVEFESIHIDSASTLPAPWFDIISEQADTNNQMIDPTNVITLQPFNFELFETHPRSNTYTYLYDLSRVMIENPELQIEIVGLSDGLANQDVNRLVGQARASRVKEYLLSQGIVIDRILATNDVDRRGLPTGIQGRIFIIGR